MITLKRMKTKTLEPLPTFEVYAGANRLGLITDTGPDGEGMRWRATAPDGKSLSAVSKAKAVQRLQIHYAQISKK